MVKFVSAFALSKNNLRDLKNNYIDKNILNEALENFDKDKHKFDLNFIETFLFWRKNSIPYR